MKLISYVFLILVIQLLNIGCTSDCSVDPVFKKKFNECLSLMEKAHTGEYRYVDITQQAAIFLANVTEKTPKDFQYDYGLYDSDEGYEEDLKHWNNWFENNKCSMTIEKADSLLRVNSFL